jgi:hypothetical protein
MVSVDVMKVERRKTARDDPRVAERNWCPLGKQGKGDF